MAIEKTLKLKSNFTTVLNKEKFEKIDIDINRKDVNFALLKLNSNKFDENTLIQYLKNASIYYALPPQRIKELQEDGRFSDLMEETKIRFKNVTEDDGEGGELISYCINEHVLGAPKILSKLKLKTNGNDYVKGADGVHILKLSDNEYEIIYAESKMYENFERAVDAAFESVDRFIEENSLEFEITTLSTNLSGEFEELDVDYLKNVILPSKKEVRQNTAFSIFIGFQIDDMLDNSLPYDVYEKQMIDYVKNEIVKHKRKLYNKLNDRKNYSFYIYFIPFVNIKRIRQKIIMGITGENDDK